MRVSDSTCRRDAHAARNELVFGSARSEDVKEWGQAPRDASVIAVFARLTRSQSPFFHTLSGRQT